MLVIVLVGKLRIGKDSKLKEEDEKAGKKIHYLRIADMLGY
jgi:hypothetical protein